MLPRVAPRGRLAQLTGTPASFPGVIGGPEGGNPPKGVGGGAGGELVLLNLGLQEALIPTINLPAAAGLFEGCAFSPF